MRDYTAAEARTVLKEMVVDTVLRLASEGKACTGVSVGVGFSGAYAERYAGGAGGSARLAQATGAEPDLMSACLAIYDAHVEPSALVRRLQVAFTGLVPAQAVQPSLFDENGRAEHAARAAQAALAVRGRFGANALLKGTSLLPEANARERHEQVGGHRA
jgi:DNA polymerase V